jgi:hypothetical protein
LPFSPSQNQSTDAAKMEPPGEVVDDAAITAMAERTLSYHRPIGTLNGEAGSHAEKDLAGKLVDDVHGVKKIVNSTNWIETP